jgi:transposase
MPKIIPLRAIDPGEMLELERMAKKGTAFEARRARFILALTNPLGLRPNQIGAAHGFSVSTSSTLRNRFNAMGPEGWRYQFNELASLGRCKLSFEAQERAVAIVKTEALTLAGIMAKLKQEMLVPKNELNGRYALADTLKRAGMSFQRTRYSLKKERPPAV